MPDSSFRWVTPLVVLASLAIAATTAAMQDRLQAFKSAGAFIGTSVSAAFLLLIALANLVILRGVWRGFRHVARGGKLDAISAAAAQAAGGILARLCRPLFRAVTQSWHVYPLGFLFGLGFNTATEVGLLGIAATQAVKGMSPWQTLASRRCSPPVWRWWTPPTASSWSAPTAGLSSGH